MHAAESAYTAKGRITVLHVIGGSTLDGGANAFVIELLKSNWGTVDHAIWMHRNCTGGHTKNLPLIRHGWTSRVASSLWGDLCAAMLEAFPLIAWVKKQPCVILHAHSRVGIFASAIVNKLAGVPLLIHLHSLAGNPGVYRRVQKLTGARAAYNSTQTCRHYGSDPAQSSIIMPTTVWPLQPAAIRGGARRFIAAGSFVRSKNFHLLIEAFKILQTEGLSAELHIFGLSNPPLDPAFQKQIVCASEESKAIHLHHWDRNWTRHLGAEDVFVHLGQPESFGIVILEAFVLGCQLLVLQNSFLDELPAPINSTGIHRVQALNVQQLAIEMRRTMQAAIGSHVNAAQLWEQRRSVSWLFSSDHSAALLMPIYESLARRAE